MAKPATRLPPEEPKRSRSDLAGVDPVGDVKKLYESAKDAAYEAGSAVNKGMRDTAAAVSRETSALDADPVEMMNSMIGKIPPDVRKWIAAQLGKDGGKELATKFEEYGPEQPEESAEDEPTESSYTVGEGDTLGSIAKKLLGDERRYVTIYMANRDTIGDADEIEPGMRLIIPSRR